MIATAVAIAIDFDVRFQTALADHFPAFVVNPTDSLERSNAVASRLADLRGAVALRASRRTAAERGAAATLPRLGAAPDFTGNERWFNTHGGQPLTLAELRGRVVLVDFWTYTCINCIRTLPHLRPGTRATATTG